MPKFLLLKHYRGAPEPEGFVAMDRWSAEEFSAHVQYMQDFAARLRETGEFVSEFALAPEGEFAAAAGDGLPATQPIPESKALVAGGMIIDVADHDRALELAAELSAAPGKDGAPIDEWLEVRPLLGG